MHHQSDQVVWKSHWSHSENGITVHILHTNNTCNSDDPPQANEETRKTWKHKQTIKLQEHHVINKSTSTILTCNSPFSCWVQTRKILWCCCHWLSVQSYSPFVTIITTSCSINYSYCIMCTWQSKIVSISWITTKIKLYWSSVISVYRFLSARASKYLTNSARTWYVILILISALFDTYFSKFLNKLDENHGML